MCFDLFLYMEYLKYSSSEQKCGGCKEHLIPGLQHFTEGKVCGLQINTSYQ